MRKATLELPSIGRLNPAKFDGLSDSVAISYARIFGRCLSEQDGFAIVTLSDGGRIVFGNDTIENELAIGHLGRSE